MTCELLPSQLTDDQKGQVCGVLSVGCDRQTAANLIGCALADIRRTMQCDPQSAASVCRAEAGSELSHMRNVQQATKETKNWRASVWWPERHSPERFGPRGPGVVTARQLKAFIAILTDALQEVVHSEDDRQKIVARLKTLTDSADQMLRDNTMDGGESLSGSKPSVLSDPAAQPVGSFEGDIDGSYPDSEL